MKALGDRMKGYEKTFSNKAMRRTPLVIRVDGKAFHTLTKGCDKPFDSRIMNSMIESALEVAKNMQGFKVGYVQSDEATFILTDYDTVDTDAWFGYKMQKIVSISAAMMSVAFNKFYDTDKSPVFDSRAFSIPVDDVINALLWRAKDWERNSLQMYCQANFSHKQLHGKNKAAMHDMLHDIGKNWTTDLTDMERNGTFLVKTPLGIVPVYDIKPDYGDISCAVDHYLRMP